MSVGLHIMRPTSIVVAGAGSSASIRADGGVDFASATSLSLNGVFTAGYDNYMLTVRTVHTSADFDIHLRLRSSGSDATGSNYTYQFLQASSTTVNAGRSTFGHIVIGTSSDDQRDGLVLYSYGPNLAQPTAFRSCQALGLNNARVLDIAGTHSLSTAYDSFTIFPASGAITGMVTVYGMAQ